MTLLTTSPSISQYVNDLHQQMTQPTKPSNQSIRYFEPTEHAEFFSMRSHPRHLESLEVAVSRQLGRL